MKILKFTETDEKCHEFAIVVITDRVNEIQQILNVISSFSQNQEIFIQGEYYRSFSLPAHTRGVSSLLVLAQGTLLSAGERDRKVAAWDTARDFVMIGN